VTISHTIQWDGNDIGTAVLGGFNFMESLDHIVGIVYSCPHVMKDIVIALQDEVSFDYIPEGIGMLRTAYLKFRPLSDSEIRLVSQDGSITVRILKF